MLVPPVAQGGTGGRPLGDTGVSRGQQSSAGTAALWPLAPAQPNQPTSQQSQATPPLAATPAPAHNQGVSRYGLYSLFPGGGGASYVAATPTTPGPPTPATARAYHATTHKVSESVFSAAVGVGVGGYTWGAPTPPPGSPYSPVPVTQLELLAKNLANLTAPSGQQAINLQGVGAAVNVGSLHHAQHTQHTLNLTGLHHLHHGGLHQSTFSPQLSLVTGNPPTLTINSFSSPNSTGVPTTGVLLQEYQSPTVTHSICSPSLNSPTCPTSTNSHLSSVNTTMVVQDTQTSNNLIHGTTKKREAFLPTQGQPVKLENKNKQSCLCKNTNGKTKIVHSDAGCSRTLPVVSSWNGQDVSSINLTDSSNLNNLVKREPLTSVPCQVAEVSTSLHATTTAVKIEPLPPKSENGIVLSNTGAGGIPVGIALARQRLQHQETSSSSMRNVSLSHHTSHHASYHHFQPDNFGSTTAMAMGGTTLVHCGPGGEDRPAHLAIPSAGGLPPSLNAALSSSLNSNLGSFGAAAATAASWPPTLWQYPAAAAAAAAAAAMPMEPVGFPQVGVGLQLVRDPSTGHLLLIHSAEQMQQAVLWPNYQSHSSSNVGPPPLLLPPPPPPPPPSLQLLGDINGARLVLTDNKRKQQNGLPIVKIEADCGNSPTAIITSTESSKALQTMSTMTGALVPDNPLVTTLHYYPHTPALVQINNQTETTHCRSQRNTFFSKATSPVSCLTPPPEVSIHTIHETPETMPVGVQDASNQTEASEMDEELPLVEPIVKQEQTMSPCHVQTSTTTNLTNFEIVSSTPEKICNVVRITTTSVNLNKVDKAENTIINMADCTKYSIARDGRTVTSIDRTIEHVINCHEERRESFVDIEPEIRNIEDFEEDRVRTGPRIIEITEENCDSFHENLEFFRRRRDPSTEQRRKSYSADNLIEQDDKEKETKENTEASIEVNEKIVQDPQPEKILSPVEPVELHSTSSNEVIDSTAKVESHSLFKSFDMPSIDDDHETERASVKVEKENAKLPENSQNPGKNSPEKNKCSETIKKVPVEKYHPGIENVVEKLKKHAAAVFQDNEAKAKEVQTPNTKSPQTRHEPDSRKLQNGLKKLILRSCENSFEKIGTLDHPGVVRSDLDSLENASLPLEATDNSLLNISENNNNNNLKNINDEETRINKDEKFIYSNLPVVDEVPKGQKTEESKAKPKMNVDLSGLELLSNSIEQLEHLKPESQNGIAEAEQSPSKLKAIAQHNENNNNVDSPLGLLCALAEQRFMEEVADSSPKKSVVENSEEISQAGRLLLNLGKASGKSEKIQPEKRKYCTGEAGDYEGLKRLKTYASRQEELAFELKENAKRNLAFSESNDINLEKKLTPLSPPYVNGDLSDSELESCDDDKEDKNHTSLPDKFSDFNHHQYSTAEAKLETKRFLRKKSHTENDTDFPNMDAMELDMRVRMADIQRQYREKQMELSKLTPKKEDKKCMSRTRNKSQSSSSECGIMSPTSHLDHMQSSQNSPLHPLDNSAVPLTSDLLTIPKLVPVDSPIAAASSTNPQEEEDNTSRLDCETPSPTATSFSSSSKKRKVGRPRKLMCTSGSSRHFTETIVAKKPKNKSSLVGYLLSAKNRHLQTKFVGKAGYTPLPFKSCLSSSKSKNQKSMKSKVKPAKQTPLHNKNVISSIIAEKAKLSQVSKLEKQCNKVKPKLKAEAKLKTWEDEETPDWNGIDSLQVIEELKVPKDLPVEVAEEEEKEIEKQIDKAKKKKRKSSCSSPSRHKSIEREKKEAKRRKSSDCKECKECVKAAKAERIENIINKCKLTSAHLAIDQLRVLTAMGGLFYAGRLSAVQAPDIYAITLDGERGNRPHIHSQEEILRDAIVEVCPASTKELPPGTRLCAYWSQQYRCLYPGTSVEPTEPDPELDEKFVSVEFDDGDSGRIALDDIRLLQPDYPVVEYDPNPLLTLGKRRRQTSLSTDEKRLSICSQGNSTHSSITNSSFSSTVNSSLSSEEKSSEQRNPEEKGVMLTDDYWERKRLKKRRRDKLKRLQESQEGKKKHKRHKCCEEHRKHKHRKHRKHKHKHSHHSSHSEGSHHSGGESCSGQKSEEDINEKSPQEDKSEEEKYMWRVEPMDNEEEPVPEVVVEEVENEENKSEKQKKVEKKAKPRERQESVESRSKMAAFLPARQLWGWSGKGYRRPGAKGRAKKQFFKAIQRGSETIQIGDSAVFLSTGRPDRPYIGRIESMWETSSSNMIVKVKWFYHPEETVGCPQNLKYPGALFESPHMDENDVQTISHKCEVLPLPDYTDKLGKEPHRYLTIYDNNDIYYLAGYYDPTTYLLTLQPGVV